MSTNVEIAENYVETEDGNIIFLSESGRKLLVVVHAYLTVLAFMMTEGSKDWKQLCEFQDIDGKVHRVWYTLADLHTRPTSVLRKFLDLGLRLGPGGREHLPKLLQSLMPIERFLQVLHTGWLADSWVYVMPHCIVGETDIPVHFEPEKNSRNRQL